MDGILGGKEPEASPAGIHFALLKACRDYADMRDVEAIKHSIPQYQRRLEETELRLLDLAVKYGRLSSAAKRRLANQNVAK